ncbi:T9SS type A sorting domain-containing protein [Hymenobacter sp. B1770]|uniref:T9SS type A sorting domain-containing protein n=1 Tax=Hymenobacter sp. B1770 TaxID=1718788 RepID=UPI003CF1C3B8
MKHFTLLLLLLVFRASLAAFGQAPAQNANNSVRPYNEPFQYGVNLGYYSPSWSDDRLAAAAQTMGVHSVRPTLPEHFVSGYGYNIRASTFNAYINTYGMKELTCFVEGPSSAHRDNTIYPGGTQPSRLFKNLYEPIWNADGTVNPNNYYAIYLFKLHEIYGDKIRFWEVVNEPDFTYGQNQNDWLTRLPLPDELPNLRAPIFHYIRMLRITYEVIKKYRPDAYITTGGVGYPQFVDCMLRYTDNPNGGAVTAQYPHKAGAYLDALSFHSYPTYSLHSWSTTLNGFTYTRSSDYAVNKFLKERQDMVDVLTKYGYGTTLPAKHLLMSETNVSRRTSGDRTASDERQRNYVIKSLILSQRHNIKQFYLYQLGESVNAPAVGTSVNGNDELALMGIFENLIRDTPGNQKATQAGQGFATTSKLLYGWAYDAARTTALALPNSLNGAAFRKNGAYAYVLWAKALVDNQESASGTYSFPSSFNLARLQRYEWNHATTNTRSTVPAQNVALTETPLFFIEDASGVVATSINPTSAVIGASVTITGTNLTGATRVSFNGTNTTTFTSNSATQLVLTVPAGATSGPVTVTTPAGTSNSVAFTVTPCPVATLAYSAGTYCRTGTNPTPTVTGPSGGAFSSTTGLSLNANTGVINLSASTSGTYTVTYRVSTTLCPTSATAQVTITNAPVATFSYGAASYCTSAATSVAPTLGAGASVGTFTASPSGLALNASTGGITLANSQPGTYTIINTIGAGGGCVASTATAQLTINAMPAASLSIRSGANNFCNGGTVVLAADAVSGATYQFNLDGQAIAGATSATYAARAGGSYTVTVTNGGGCGTTSQPIALTAEAAPDTPVLTATEPAPNTVILTSNSPAHNQFFLDGRPLHGNQGQTYTVTSPTQNGVYTVTATSSGGCASASSAPVPVNLRSTATSTATALAGSTLNVYPNPTPDGRLTIDLAGYRKGVQLSVVNALGQVVFESSVPAGQALPLLDLHHLPAGVYSVSAQTADGLATRRFVRQ